MVSKVPKTRPAYDGPVISGYAALARTQEQAQAVMTSLVAEPAGTPA